MELSEKDRLIIANQLRILEKLYPEEAQSYSNHRKAIECGYKLHYSWLTEGFFEEMSEDESQKVLTILAMYSAITFSYQKAEDKDGLEESEIRFRGFDGNNEGKQFGYALYFIVDLGRYTELTGGVEYPDLNSHEEMMGKYGTMLNIWNAYPDKYSMTIAQIKELLEA